MMRLIVDYAEKDLVKRLGAKWNPEEKFWYTKDGVDLKPFAKWLPRDVGPLFVDLVPSTAWFSNLRSELTAAEWTVVAKKSYVRAGYRCEICLGKGHNHPVECHERWEYDSATKIQKLVDVVALCPACHESTHIGLAETRGRLEPAMNNLMKVAKMTEQEAIQHVDMAYILWEVRSKHEWILDARWLLDFAEMSEPTKAKILSHIEPHYTVSNDIGSEDWELVPESLAGVSYAFEQPFFAGD